MYLNTFIIIFYGLPRKPNHDSALIDKAQKIVQDTKCAATFRLFQVKWLWHNEVFLGLTRQAGNLRSG